MTSASPAASTASSSSWRSSARRSWSPRWRAAQEQVVAVGCAAAGEGAVVEADEAHDPVGHRAHRHERAHREVAGAERGPGGLAAQAVGEEVAELGQPQRRGPPRRPASSWTSTRSRSSWARCQASVGRVSNRRSAAASRRSIQAVTGRGAARSPTTCAEAADELGEPAGQVDVARVDVVERQDAADEPLVVLGHRDAEQEALQAGVPRAGVDARRGRRASGGGPSRPHRVPVASTHSAIGSRSSSSNPNRWRTGGRAAKASTWDAVRRASTRAISSASGAEHRVGLAQRAVGQAVRDRAVGGRRRRRTRRAGGARTRRCRGRARRRRAARGWGRRRGGG